MDVVPRENFAPEAFKSPYLLGPFAFILLNGIGEKPKKSDWIQNQQNLTVMDIRCLFPALDLAHKRNLSSLPVLRTRIEEGDPGGRSVIPSMLLQH